MAIKVHVYLIGVVLMTLEHTPLAKEAVHAPPTIVEQPPREVSLKDREKVQLECVARGAPAPTYQWKKDDQPLAITGIDIRQLPSVGTIVIEDPQVAEHEGVYQCTASNEFGTAISVKTVLRKAVQEPFPTVKEPKIHRPAVGTSLTLRCQPPYGYPKGVVYWGEYKAGSKLKPIENSERVSLDYDGNLHFANVLPEDDRRGLHYVCIVQNTELRSLMQGDDQKVDPNAAVSPRYEAPKLMWASQSQVAIRGQSHKIKCIFSGYPTPRVSWIKVGSPPFNASKVQVTSFGQELNIESVEPSDEGVYECSAVNTDQRHPRATHRIQISVESPPYWKDDKPPEDVNTSEEESAQFNCEVEGNPRPEITWYMNGVPLRDLRPNPRRIVANHYVRYENVTKTDAQVLQCNASNKHGYIFSNSYLNVLAEAPSFVETPQPVTKAAEGQTVVLTCQVFGAPKPTITWKKDNEPLMLDRRFKKESNGNLRITDVRSDDAGQYQCFTQNKFGHEESNGKLIVREKTIITDRPSNKTVTVGNDVTLHCNATTDPDERRKLEIIWMRHGYPIDYQSENNLALYTVDKSLKITHARVDNTGSYTCNATNGLDWDAVTMQLTVKGRPDPPYDIRIVSCGTQKAEIAWIPGSDNNDPVIDYIVYYNTSFDKPDQYTDGSRVPVRKQTAQIRLDPWTNYTFHVVSRNSLGASDRSPFTSAVCTTPQQRPFKNPKGVCSESRGPRELAIVWEAMPQTDHNGEDFHYLVSYKPTDVYGDEIKAKVPDIRTTDSTRRAYVVDVPEMYKEYIISVQAANQEGPGPAHTVERKIGYSGQGVPLDQPLNFRLNESSLNVSSAEFLWEPVDESVERVQGFFRGYQIRFWKTGNTSTERTEDVILRSWEPCREAPFVPTRRRRSSKQPVKGHTSQLWPYSSITAGVSVLNAGGQPGPLSQTVEFRTLEGVPSAARNFHVTEKGSHHLKLSWNLPFEYNGNPTGYTIEYKKAPPAMGSIKTKVVDNVLDTNAKLIDLDADTLYVVYIWATTKAGRGEREFLEDRTNLLADPSPPVIASWDTGDDFVNLTWTPTSSDPAENANPGHKFAVEYRKTGGDGPWTTVGPTHENNWLNVSGLESGTEYEFRVVAMNNGENTTASKPTVIYVGPIRPGPIERAEGPNWLILIILICILILLLIVLLIIAVIWRNRGGKYAVHEKEKLRGHESNNDEDDVGFGEYTRTPRTELKYSDEPHKKSQASINSDEKPLDEDSETDSLGEYEDPDPSKFNEDGSFIGQYGGKKKSSERIDQHLLQHDGTPSALSTFV